MTAAAPAPAPRVAGAHLAALTFLALDFETTGQGQPVRPIRVGVARMRGVPGLPPDRWPLEPVLESFLFLPRGEGINPFAARKCGIRERDCWNAPTLASLWPALHRAGLTDAAGVHIVAHARGTESKVLAGAFPEETARLDWVDTLPLAQVAWPALAGGHKLENVVGYLGLEASVRALHPAGRWHHSPLFDALGTLALLRHLLAEPGWAKVARAWLRHPVRRA